MDVVLPLLVLSIPLVALLWYGVRRAFRYDRKHRKRRHSKKATTDEEDATFFELIRPIWKNPRD